MSYTIKKVRNKEPDVKKASYIADGAFIAGDVRLGENVSIWSNCSIRGDLASIIILLFLTKATRFSCRFFRNI